MEKDKNELDYFDMTKIILEQKEKVKMIKENEQRILKQQKRINRNYEPPLSCNER